MYYNFSRTELKNKNATDFQEGDTINVKDSHYEIWIKYGSFENPSLCSVVLDLNKGVFQDVVLRQDYISKFLHR